jgi:hypothetical protein
MHTAPSSRPASIAVLIALAFNSLFLIGNGMFMLVAPKVWYDVIPGVIDTGFFNQHFVRDIGMIQFFLGAGFALGMLRPAIRVELWAAATLWLLAHAAFHVWEVAVGICAPFALLRDFPAVSLPALLGIALTVHAIRERAR